VDNDHHDESQYGYGPWPPITFSAKNGDLLRIVATDGSSVGCRDLSPLFLYRISDGVVQTIDPVGVPVKCDSGGSGGSSSGGVFYDKSIHIILPTLNQPPAVSVGPNQTITLPGAANLNGTVTDDGLPNGGILSSTWSTVSGPGTVTFGIQRARYDGGFQCSRNLPVTLTATDSQLTSYADVTITVNPAAASAAITSVNPNTGQQGQQSLLVTIKGLSTSWGATTTAGFGAGINVVSLTVQSTTNATALLNIDATAATGPRTVTLTTGAQIESLPNGFRCHRLKLRSFSFIAFRWAERGHWDFDR
jgi:hypothetical protein